VDLRTLLAGMPEITGGGPHTGHEYVNGWGVFALPFTSGDILALRVFPQTNFGPYRAVWHRDRVGQWSIYVDGGRLDHACPRYFGPACAHTGLADIEVTWIGQNSLQVQMPEPALEWTMTASTTPTLTVFNTISRRLPHASWRPRALVRGRERMARRLGMGDIQLSGAMPSGHTGHLRPEQMFFINESQAVLDGTDLGSPIRLPDSPVIGDFRLPSRGVLVKGGALWDVLEPTGRDRAQVGSDT
jgi:hypothetical protein